MQSRSRRLWLANPAVRVCVAAVWFTAALRAHEPGTTGVSVLFEEGRTYDVDVVTDASALVDKLEASAGEASPPIASPARLQSLLTRFDEKFRQRVHVRFDASEVRPAIAYSVVPGTDPASAPVATIRFTGQIPANARYFTWSYGWTFTSYAMTVRNDASEQPPAVWLEGDQLSAPFALTPPVGRLATARRYLTLGFIHSVPRGLDHALFVLGICLLSSRARSVLWQVSALTVAYSITLGLSTYGIVAMSPRVVDPLIALSIGYVAIENVFLAELTSWRVALVFAFGLLHGMALAGTLKQLGPPRSELVTALVTFNLGVEAGLLAVVGAAFLLVGWQYGNRAWHRRHVVVPLSMLIACAAVYWTIERLSF